MLTQPSLGADRAILEITILPGGHTPQFAERTRRGESLGLRRPRLPDRQTLTDLTLDGRRCFSVANDFIDRPEQLLEPDSR
jgi:hypothetical protein